jgi:hypothetical protein
MACGYFEAGRLCRCAAVRGLLVPSLYERERYCLSDDPTRCPTLRARARRDDALPEEVYYALWLPWADTRGDEPLDDGAEPPGVRKQHVTVEPVCGHFTAE